VKDCIFKLVLIVLFGSAHHYHTSQLIIVTEIFEWFGYQIGK